MPHLIADTDFGLEDDSQNEQLYNQLIRKSNVYMGIDNGSIQLLRANNRIHLVDKEKRKILYYMHLGTVRKGKLCLDYQGTNRKACKQMRVWRSPALGVYEGLQDIPKKVFYEQLKNYDIIISDGLQTEDGKRFWVYRLTESLLQGREVFFQDMHKKREQGRVRIQTQKQLQQFIDVAWGNKPSQQGKVFIIGHKITGTSSVS